ncbi:MAG: hypothetical protein ABUS54_10365 [Actinomycetota bacterium]
MKRGDQLLLAHLASLDAASPPARVRLEEALGDDLARKLVSALCAGAPRRAEPPELRPRAVFAA